MSKHIDKSEYPFVLDEYDLSLKDLIKGEYYVIRPKESWCKYRWITYHNAGYRNKDSICFLIGDGKYHSYEKHQSYNYPYYVSTANFGKKYGNFGSENRFRKATPVEVAWVEHCKLKGKMVYFEEFFPLYRKSTVLDISFDI